MNRILLIAFLLTSVSQAQWSTDPANNLIVGYGLLPELASDSAGGCYITYEQNLSYPRHLILERLNRYGYKPWGASRQILGEFPEQYTARLAEDGNGGVIVAYSDRWADSIFAPRIRVRAQRVDSSGNFLWGQTGVRVSLSETNQGSHAIVNDGTGGCIVAWIDLAPVGFEYEYHLRINRMNSAGFRIWGDSGKFVWNYGFQAPGRPLIAADGRGGCILVFGASRVQRIDQSGIPLWGPSGIQLENIGISMLASDGSSGVLLAGMKFISYNNGDPLWAAKAQRLDSVGQILWGGDGLVLEDSLHGLFLNPPGIALETNIDGGGTFAWGKRVRPNVIRTFVQKVRAFGAFVFPDSGVQVSTIDSGGVGTWGIITSLEDSKIFINADARYAGSTLAQRIDSTGRHLWDSSDVTVGLLPLGSVSVTTDGMGGCIVVGAGGSFTIRAQQMSKNGNLGEVITSITHSDFHQPHQFVLHQNYPNPFNSATVINYTVPLSSWIDISVYNILGQKLVTLVDSHHPPGKYSAYFRADGFPSGVYYYRMSNEGVQTGIHTRKLLIIK